MPAVRPFGKRLAVLALCLAFLAVASGCSVVRGTISTFTALGKAGFQNPQVDTSGGDVVKVRVRRDTEDLTAAARQAAEIVWDNLPLPITRLTVVCENGFGGTGTYSGDRLELEAAFGPRDPKLDTPVQDAELRKLGLVVIGVVLFGVVALVAIVVTIVLLVRRNRRQSQPPPPPPGWYPGGPVPPYHPPS
jgi:hypothetical protein